MEYLRDLANADPLARRWGRKCDLVMLLGLGNENYFIRVRGGAVASVDADDGRIRSWDFAIRGPKSAWDAFWAAVPAPTFHDLIAMRACGHITIEGNLRKFFANILYVKRLLELPRAKRDAA
ncbi:MAG: hypothetical protein OEU46_19700 [Alphaproteobacteria bacterium]|nr:hypothetical protein [Alphaproteobacteria bacterium]